MRLIDGDLIYKAIPAEEDNNTGMGMTFDEMDAYNDGIDAMYRLIQGAPTVEAIPKADYENRLKADMVAMLTEIQLEIHELENPYPHDYDDLLPLAQHNGFYEAKSSIEDLVNEKINSLKEVKDVSS